MITADLGAELTAAVRGAVRAGILPEAAATRSSGTLRQPPGGAPGSYASSLPFEIARRAGLRPTAVAEILAARLRLPAWIGAVTVTGDGYLTVEVTPPALAALAVRIVVAGPACARSGALAGTDLTAPPLPDLAAAATWQQARQDQAAALTGRLAAAAGATVIVTPEAKRMPPTASPAPPRAAAAPFPAPATPAGQIGDPVRPMSGPVLPVPVSAGVAYAGPDIVRYLLARAPAGAAGGGAVAVSNRLSDPAHLVRFARADAAAVRRWAADLGLARGDADDQLAVRLGLPAERALLDQLSWLPERIASAARRRRPDEFPRYLEGVAAAWLDCRESCPALPFGGQRAPRNAAGTSARLWLAEAARTVLDSGLKLIGIDLAGVSRTGLL